MHSMSINDPCLTPWIIINHSDVLSAHCDCVAGMGEVCSHVGAVLYYLTSLSHHQLLLSQSSIPGSSTSTTASVAVTDMEQRWGGPSKRVAGNLQMPLEDINFGYTRESSDDAYGKVAVLQLHDIRAKLNVLQIGGVKCTAMQAFCDSTFECYKCEENTLDPFYEEKGLILNTLYHESNREKNIEQLRFMSLSFYSHIQKHANEECRRKVENETRTQSSCELWKLLRIGRVTASVLKNVLTTKIDKPSLSLLKTICYPDESYFSTQATRYGKKMEKTALNQLICFLEKSHKEAKVIDSGLILHKDYPEMAASPDAILLCSCCGKIPIEIKCPFTFKDEDNVILRLTKCKPGYLEKSGDSYKIVENHKYYAQVQMQIALTEARYGYFYIWTKNENLLIPVEKNESFWQEAKSKAILFFKAVIIPELLGKYFTKG